MKVKYFITLVALTFVFACSNASFAQAQKTDTGTEQSQPTPLITPNPFIYNGVKGTSGIFTYKTLNDAGDIEIIDIDTTESKLVIPAIIDGHQVKKINLETLTSDGQLLDLKANSVSKNYVRELVISDGVEEICDHSFMEFANLEKITLAKNLQIGESVFGTCPVKELTLNGGGIGRSNFDYCEFEKIKIEGEFYGAYQAFSDCKIKKVIVDAPYADVGGLFDDTKVNEMHVSKRVKRLTFAEVEDINGNQLDRLYINGTKTRLVFDNDAMDLAQLNVNIGTVYLESGAKAIADVKDEKLTYQVKKTGKAKTYTAKKQGSKYRVAWKKVKTTIQTNKYNKSKKKWSKKTKNTKTMYQVYGRMKKSGKFKLIKTTAQRKITSKYKYIRVVPVKSW